MTLRNALIVSLRESGLTDEQVEQVLSRTAQRVPISVLPADWGYPLPPHIPAPINV